MVIYYRFKEFLKNFSSLTVKDRFVQIAIVSAVLINLGIWALLYFKLSPLREQININLHYNVYFGIDLIGQWHN